jgi:hypothetical protein
MTYLTISDVDARAELDRDAVERAMEWAGRYSSLHARYRSVCLALAVAALMIFSLSVAVAVLLFGCRVSSLP